MEGLTAGIYVTRSARYEVRADGTIWLIGGLELPEGAAPRQIDELPRDAVMTNAALRGPIHSGATPPGKGPDPERRLPDRDKERR